MTEIYTLSPDEADSIIDDLLKKYPAGPRGNWTKEDYTVEYDMWSSSAGVYRDVPMPPIPYFGYSVDKLMRVYSYMLSRGGTRQYIGDRFKIGTKAVSRRYNRLEDRVKPAVQKFKRGAEDGTPAIYEVSIPGLHQDIHVIATSTRAAETLAKTVCAGAGVIASDGYYHTVRQSPADHEILRQKRASEISNITNTIKSSQAKIRQIKDKVTKLLDISVVLSEFNLQTDE
tara:strand:- start:873 stop:1559 length:687 start_codon:yes stop_codon:yes gene_type:complete